MLKDFAAAGKASFALGGQYGSEGKGAAVAYLATCPDGPKFDIVATNNGSQSGHTSVHDGVKRVTFHLPTYSLLQPAFTYLDAGSIIDIDVLIKELDENPQVIANGFAIHPNAAIITQACKDAEGRDNSAQTRIASTRKGVGEALSRKVLRSGLLAKDLTDPAGFLTEAHPIRRLMPYIRRLDLNDEMRCGKSVLVEIPQGHSLSIDSQFYPHTTSRNCTVMQAMSDAGIHPDFYHQSMLVLRTYPIRVGNIEKPVRYSEEHGLYVTGQPLGHSGDCFPDQREITWEQLGQTPEITTVTKRVRRVFTFSEQQAAEAIAATRPDLVFLSFCDYLSEPVAFNSVMATLCRLSRFYGRRGKPLEVLTAWGPSTADVKREEEL